MTLLLEIAEWAWSHPGEVSLNAILFLILRKFIMKEVHKLLHLGREGELQWIREQVETLTGEKYDGVQPILKRVRTRYIRNYYSYLRKETQQGNQRRKKKMNQLLSGKKKYLTFIILVVLNGLNDTLQLHLTPQTITNVSALGGGYIVIEGILDIVRAYVNKDKTGGTPNVPTQPTGDSGAAV